MSATDAIRWTRSLADPAVRSDLARLFASQAARLARLAPVHQRLGIDHFFQGGEVPGRYLPDYPGGPLNYRIFGDRLLTPIHTIHPSPRYALIVCAGGDCTGYNQIVLGAYRMLRRRGFHIFGSLNGPAGLTNPRSQIIEITDDLADQLMTADELLLATGSRRMGPFGDIDQISGLPEGAPMANFHNALSPFVEGAVLFVGGEGTMTMTKRIYEETAFQRVLFAGASMDKDIPGLGGSVGFASTRKHVIASIRGIRTTAAACNKLHIVLTMGGQSGSLPLEAAIEGGATAVIIPESGPVELKTIAEKLLLSLLANHGAVLVIGESGTYLRSSGEKVSYKPKKGLQSAGDVQTLEGHILKEMSLLAEERYPNLKVEVRSTILGHTQRQPVEPALEDLLRGYDIGLRLGEAAFEGRFGTAIPFLPGSPIPFAEVFSDESYRQMHEEVVRRWLEKFGRDPSF